MWGCDTREKRIAEMMAQASRNKFGDIQPISKDEWTREVTEGSSENWVIAYLWDSALEECKLMDNVLRVVAKNHRDVKFVSIQAQVCIENWPARYGSICRWWCLDAVADDFIRDAQELPDALHVPQGRPQEPAAEHPQAWRTRDEG